MMKDKSSKYTIEDIAKRAGVSRQTISRVLNNHPSVSDETRQTVLEIIAELSYRPNYSARHMRTQDSKLVGLITHEVITTPHAVDMISGAQDTLWAQGKLMLIVNANYGPEMTEAALEALLERRVEGIVYMMMFHREVELPPQMSGLPIVLANCYSKNRDFASIVPDEVGGGYAATKLLLRKGHRRIAFINLGKPPNRLPPLAAAAGRLAGYKKALSEYGIPFDEALLKYTNQMPQVDYQLTKELMNQTNPPSAIFCGNDRAAMGCYGALTSLKLRIPDDVAVVGFDNQLMVTENLWPRLTSIQLPHYEMGQWAVEQLSSAILGSLPVVQELAECRLVEREST